MSILSAANGRRTLVIITLVVLVLLLLDTSLIYFWGALEGYNSGVHFWFR